MRNALENKMLAALLICNITLRLAPTLVRKLNRVPTGTCVLVEDWKGGAGAKL